MRGSGVLAITHSFTAARRALLYRYIGALLPKYIIVTNGIFVPDSVQAGNTSSVVLNCNNSVNIRPILLLQWYFNDDKDPVYQWRPQEKPIVRGVLEGHLDLSKSGNSQEAQRVLHLYNLVPEMSGEYTCVAHFEGAQMKQTKRMLVYSPQEDLSINWKINKTEVEVRCSTQGVYPKPDLILQRDGITVDNQHSRSWKNGRGLLYDAETVASFWPQELRDTEEFACRLRLPETPHFGIIKTNIIFIESTYFGLGRGAVGHDVQDKSDLS
ncbi:hypothetical protein EVAR_13587_1 [Eumeta japonica]|uniref:Ig-like domain-containing protein n=1 Tax=Eumeta variegata TaxID=151549 RepID=A0A4C1UA83_EUMVA|nr:hypothetical protein EVAR_13587_1 [Eumeta japonica]